MIYTRYEPGRGGRRRQSSPGSAPKSAPRSTRPDYRSYYVTDRMLNGLGFRLAAHKWESGVLTNYKLV